MRSRAVAVPEEMVLSKVPRVDAEDVVDNGLEPLRATCGWCPGWCGWPAGVRFAGVEERNAEVVFEHGLACRKHAEQDGLLESPAAQQAIGSEEHWGERVAEQGAEQRGQVVGSGSRGDLHASVLVFLRQVQPRSVHKWCGDVNGCCAAAMMNCFGNSALHHIKRGVHQAACAQRAAVLCQ